MYLCTEIVFFTCIWDSSLFSLSPSVCMSVSCIFKCIFLHNHVFHEITLVFHLHKNFYMFAFSFLFSPQNRDPQSHLPMLRISFSYSLCFLAALHPCGPSGGRSGQGGAWGQPCNHSVVWGAPPQCAAWLVISSFRAAASLPYTARGWGFLWVVPCQRGNACSIVPASR